MSALRSGFRRGASTLAALVALGAPHSASGSRAGGEPASRPPAAPATRTVYDFHVATIAGADQPLATYRGKVLLIVNTASHCGFTPQYEALETLYQRYRDRGFEVLAFPANNFLNQEPGDNAEIQSFCTLKYRTTFPLFAKIDVRGKRMAPLYTWLTRDTDFRGAIPWNFTKFVVARDGRVAARFDPAVDPLDAKVTSRIEAELAAH